MAIGKIWNVNATPSNTGESGNEGVQKSISYIMDDKKTSFIIDDLEFKTIDGKVLQKSDAETMLNEIQYVANSLKTREGTFVGAVHTHPKTALDDFDAIRNVYGKNEGRLLTHMVMSFPADEKDVDKIWAAGRQWANDICGDNYQGIFAMHLNTDNYHIHLLVNSVGLDGRKFHMDKNYVSNVLQPTINKACRDNGLSENTTFGKKFEKSSMSYADWNNQMRHDIDEAIVHSFNFKEFKEYLQNKGYVVNVGKHISLRAETHEKGQMSYARRTGKLGEVYTPDMIEKRLSLKEEDLVASFYEKLPESKVRTFAIFKRSEKLPKWCDMSYAQKEYVRNEFRKGNNPFVEDRASWAQFRQVENRLKVLGGLASLNKYGCYDVSDIPATIEKIRNLEKEQAANLSEIKSEMKITRDIRKLYKEIRSLESRALLYDVYGDSTYKEYSEKYHNDLYKMEAFFGHSYEEVYKFIQDQDYAVKTIEENKKILAKDMKTCYNILKAMDKEAKHGIILGDDKSNKTLLDIREYAKSIQRLDIDNDLSRSLDNIGILSREKRFRQIDTNYEEIELTPAEKLITELGGKIDRNTWTFLKDEETKNKVFSAIKSTPTKDLTNTEVFCSVREADVVLIGDKALIRVPYSYKKDGDYKHTKKDALSGNYIAINRTDLSENSHGGYSFPIRISNSYDICDIKGNIKNLNVNGTEVSKAPGMVVAEHYNIRAFRTVYTGKIRKIGDSTFSFDRDDLLDKQDGIYTFRVDDNMAVRVHLSDLELKSDPNWGTTYSFNIKDKALYSVVDASGNIKAIGGSEIRYAAEKVVEAIEEARKQQESRAIEDRKEINKSNNLGI